ncbi:NAD-dependent epimerase/dehydratase family protein [Blastococcus tunisiensis]|uniref:GDP-L-fucose synthase n=1 Tax=Blastococcus tunisiensis TaxID=1798228 RepID=A0A1I1WP39_9ACTN|nr:NAD-dependent epimerase/dehydratase family protein [Blastococcus sp. DSM 46838]SFD94860.1 GDP-L-fucose synthase [Blastococcus sp. DSM 46838]
MRLLITGGRGMVGSNLVRGLSEAHEVQAPGRDTFDLLDARSVQETVSRLAPDLIIHAAGRVGGIAANAAANALFLYENTMMGLNVLEAARLAGVPRVLNLGSSCIYPKDRDEQLREDDLHTGPLEPTNEGYAVAKIAVLKYAAMLRNDDPRCDYKTAIPCNLYGPGDHFEPPRSHMVPSAIRKIDDARRAGDAEVEIWGDGTARREFMYVGDLVDFVGHAIERWDTLPPLVNVGLGHDYTINEYYAEIADVVGWGGTFVHDTSKLVGMKRKLLSVDLADAWGWKAPTSLTDGLRRTYEHYLETAR